MSYMPYFLPSTEGGVGGVEKNYPMVVFSTLTLSSNATAPYYNNCCSGKDGDVNDYQSSG